MDLHKVYFDVAYNLNKVIRKEFEKLPQYAQTHKEISKYIKLKENILKNYPFIFKKCGKNDEKRINDFTKLDVNYDLVKKHVFDDKKKKTRFYLQKSYSQYLKTFKEYKQRGWEVDNSMQENADFIKNKIRLLNEEEKIYSEQIHPFLEEYKDVNFDDLFENLNKQLQQLNDECLTNVCKKIILSEEHRNLVDSYLKLKKECPDISKEITFKYFKTFDDIVNDKLKNRSTIRFEEQVNSRISEIIKENIERE